MGNLKIWLKHFPTIKQRIEKNIFLFVMLKSILILNYTFRSLKWRKEYKWSFFETTGEKSENRFYVLKSSKSWDQDGEPAAPRGDVDN